LAAKKFESRINGSATQSFSQMPDHDPIPDNITIVFERKKADGFALPRVCPGFLHIKPLHRFAVNRVNCLIGCVSAGCQTDPIL